MGFRSKGFGVSGLRVSELGKKGKRMKRKENSKRRKKEQEKK